MTSIIVKLLNMPPVSARLAAHRKMGSVLQWDHRSLKLCSCALTQVRLKSFKTDVEDEVFERSSFGKKIIEYRLRLGLRRRDKPYYMRRSAVLFETVDDLNIKQFFKEFQMEDTFVSWFLIAELHIWMILVRSRAEGEEGVFLNKLILEYMWQDIETRGQKLSKDTGRRAVNKGAMELCDQMLAAILGYDEGLQTSDAVLAGALWNRFLSKRCDDPEMLEKLLAYVRKQIQHLDLITRDDFLGKAKVTWLPLLDRA